MVNKFTSTHKLEYLQAPPNEHGMIPYMVGTCHGLFYTTKTSYCILVIVNNEPGNGHLTDVIEWFEFACKRNKKNLVVDEIQTRRFYHHLIEKRGFAPSPDNPDSVIKIYFEQLVNQNQHA